MAKDPTGPEPPEETPAARDAEPDADELAARRKAAEKGNGKSARDRADDEPPEPPPLEGDKQMSLAGLGRRGLPVENKVSLMSASVPIDGLIDPEKEGQLLVAYEPAGYDYVPVRETDKTGTRKVVRWKLVQQLRPTHIVRADTEAGRTAAEGK